VTVHELSRIDARRVAVRAQLLDGVRPTELLDVVRHLTLLQIDPTAAIAPSADLVAWSRLGSSYSPAELDTALADRTLLELRGMIRPGEDLALYRADMAEWEWSERGELPGWRESHRDWVRANDACRLDILDRLGSSGPLPARDLPDTCKVPWRSTGWTNNRNVTQLLEFMVDRPFSGRAALLSPFDRLIHDRKRTVELFEFDYQLEMYKPAAKRRWGYFALPILYGDRLVGKLDATADRTAGVFRVDAIHQDVAFTKTMTAAVDREIKDLAHWLELDLTLPG
jgi:uncharacterized protein YcaQ